MGIEPPFLYDRPSKYTFASPSEKAFNPKAATQAAWAPKPPRPKPDGPLIDAKEFNRHPDSYFIRPYGNLDKKSMSPHTKSLVKWLRMLQLALRICLLAGSAGLLVCVICIKPTGSPLDWIIRVPPGIAMLHTVYAIYHLSKSSKGRTPASSASYMIFAAVIDAGLLPFLGFTAMMARMQLYAPVSAEGRWDTVFNTSDSSKKVIRATYLDSLALGSIHVVSLCLSMYLALVFRRIARLPPDMNPLEDNLTSRHKRNKSSLSVADQPVVKEQHLSPTLIESSRQMPFMNTRMDSSTNIVSPSRHRLTVSRDSYRNSAASSAELAHAKSHDRAGNARPANPKDVERHSICGGSENFERFYMGGDDNSSISLEDGESFKKPRTILNQMHRLTPPELRHLVSYRYEEAQDLLPKPTDKYDFTNRSPRPLEMHPPTPPTTSARRGCPDRQIGGFDRQDSSPATWEEIHLRNGAEARHFQPSPGPTNQKRRFYGDLRSSVARQYRVVSSGVDTGSSIGQARARDVSGKVAEEGRGAQVVACA